MGRQYWSDTEVDAIVRDYFQMLEAEQNGDEPVKSHHRRALMDTISRSEGAIEWKHQNISAVLDLLGLPYIDGYKPGRNYQRALVEAVEGYLKDHPDLHAFLAGENLSADQVRPETVAATPLALEFAQPPDPPSHAPSGQDLSPEIRQVILRFESPADRDARNRRLGRAGEKVVFESERHRLLDLGRSDLAESVRWVAKDDGDGFGYDIKSFSGVGNDPETERWLEVKTTTGSITTPFFITKNELRVSDAHRDSFRVVRLYDFRRQVRAFRLRPPLEDRVRLSPEIYRASF